MVEEEKVPDLAQTDIRQTSQKSTPRVPDLVQAAVSKPTPKKVPEKTRRVQISQIRHSPKFPAKSRSKLKPESFDFENIEDS